MSGRSLEQGDLIPGLVVLEQEIPPATPTTVETKSEVFPLTIVMTQSCDLRLDRGDTHAVLCPVHTVDKLLVAWKTWDKVGAAWGEAKQGKSVNYYPLARCVIEGHELREALVDFKRVLEVKLQKLEEFAEARGPRLRLRSPYREQLAQQFARKIMRIGLPVDVPDWKSVPQ